MVTDTTATVGMNAKDVVVSAQHVPAGVTVKCPRGRE
jgi:hypothetical protein